VRLNGTLVEDKLRRFKGECEHFRFNKCPIYTHDGASAKFSSNSQEMDNSVDHQLNTPELQIIILNPAHMLQFIILNWSTATIFHVDVGKNLHR
jgi:hypothetical protein